ncbi:hypothetical protein Dda_0363 [Drechslerella dactyloides]|uniref:Zn(2)-C6 fungal-type domain-containing protein n=1 Tax=Drechslerella dactyloides TaxID=74499 RepID=A0AAD6NNE2_DREDA|nr:hypothetical protein Dda_0363 [Drechslerella dactyloides]
MARHRIQLDFLMTPAGDVREVYSWAHMNPASPDASTSTSHSNSNSSDSVASAYRSASASQSSSGPSRIVELADNDATTTTATTTAANDDPRAHVTAPAANRRRASTRRSSRPSTTTDADEDDVDMDDDDDDDDDDDADDNEHDNDDSSPPDASRIPVGRRATTIHHQRKGRGKQAFRHRKSHIKSKNGCFSCKERRVKCDEAKPECHNCLKRALRCEYPPPPSAPEIVFAQPFVADGKGAARVPGTRVVTVVPVALKKLEKSLKPIDMGPHCLPKALEFRMSKYNQIPVQVGMPDLRLMQNFTMNASQTLILGPNTSLWRRDAAELAFKHNFLMHALLMFSARHLAMLEPHEKEHQILELQHRQHALGTLRLTLSDVGVTADNYDALIAANTLLAFHSCATYDLGNVDPATDEYLPLMNGVKNIVKAMWGKKQDSIFGGLLSMPLTMDSRDVELDGLEIIEMLEDQEELDGALPFPLPESAMTAMSQAMTAMGAMSGRDRCNPAAGSATGPQLTPFIRDGARDRVGGVLQSRLKNSLNLVYADSIPNFDWAAHGNIIYQKVLLSLLPLLEAVRTAPDSIQMDMTSNISCALVAWPAMQPDRYIELVQRKDAKALIILAHYYAAMCHLDLHECWWLQGRPRAMCRSICREIGEAYPHFMRWPREACGYDECTFDDDADAEGIPISAAEFIIDFERV